MAESYVALAVDSMAAHHVTNLETELRQVETDNSLTANALTDPEAYVKYRAPFDNRSPIIQIYDEGGGPAEGDGSQRTGIFSFRILVVLLYAGEGDFEINEVFVRRYATAMLRTVLKDITLGGTVIHSILMASGHRRDVADNTTIYKYGTGWDVEVNSQIAC